MSLDIVKYQLVQSVKNHIKNLSGAQLHVPNAKIEYLYETNTVCRVQITDHYNRVRLFDIRVTEKRLD